MAAYFQYTFVNENNGRTSRSFSLERGMAGLPFLEQYDALAASVADHYGRTEHLDLRCVIVPMVPHYFADYTPDWLKPLLIEDVFDAFDVVVNPAITARDDYNTLHSLNLETS